MGKTKKNRIRYSANSNPLNVPRVDKSDTNGFWLESEQLELEPQSGPVEAIRDQLLNPNIEEKLNGLQSFALLATNKQKVKGICESDLIRVAAPLLCEKDEAVRNAAAGAIRNLSVCGVEICEYLVEQDVLTPLFVLLNEYACDAQWTPTFDTNACNQLDLHSDVFLQAINLLWNLCESTSVALDFFNQTQLLEGFIRCLDYKIFGLDIAVSVAQCLLVVSENNLKSWNILSQHVPTFLHLLTITGEHSHSYLRTLTAGILANVPALAAAYTATLFTTLGKALDEDHKAAISNVLDVVSVQKNKNKEPELEVNMDTADSMTEETEEAAALRRRKQELPSDADLVVRNVGYLLDAQRLAAEVITNLCTSDEEEWMDADEEDASDVESVVDYEGEDDLLKGNQQDSSKLSVEIVEAIKSMGLIDKLWQNAQPMTESLVHELRENNISLLLKAKNVRISTLLCLQNLSNTLSIDDLGGPSAIYNVWVELGQQVLRGPQDWTVLEPSTSLMRSALEHLKTNKELFGQMTKNDLELILNGIRMSTMPEIRANWLRMLGTLGYLLPEALAKMIISFIVETCQKEEDVWTISEALDALMDMFSDNDWPELVNELNLVDSSKKLERTFKTKVRQQKRDLKERYPAVQTVRTNFTRFVKYIEKLSVQ